MPRLAAAVVGLLVAVPFFLRLPLIERRGFNPDELEHLHFAWNVSKGKLPYRDYFDHHTPALHYALAPIFRFHDVEISGDAAVGALFTARRLMWPAAAAILALTFALARAWHPDRRVAWLAALLLSNTGVFLAKTFDVRPDVPATALVLGGLLLAATAWKRMQAGRAGAGWESFGSGLLLGAATLFTQKVLFLGPGLLAAVVLLLLDPVTPASRVARMRAIAAQAAGFLLPIGATLGYFFSRGALEAFFEANIVVNARWPGLGPREFVRIFFQEDAPFVVLAVLGFLLQARTMLRPESRGRGEPLVALALLSPVAALAIHPAVTFHYFLLFVPQAALYAAAGLLALVDRVGRTRFSEGALAAACVLLSVQPLLRLRATFDRGNWSTLQGIRYVIRNAAPWETTFDGFSGLGVFRPAASFHPFHHWHILAIQSDAERRSTLEALRRGAALPKLVFWDSYLREGVTPEVAEFLETNYVPTGLEPIRVRPFDNGLGWWTDEGPRYLGWTPGHERAPHVLFGEGWRDPAMEDGTPCRRTRTRASHLVVPIRHPRDSRVVLRAKADAPPGPFAIELVVNGESCGHVVSVPRWQDYEFHVPGRHLRPGFNRFELRYSQPGAGEERRLEVAAESLALYRVSSPAR
jgi:hypothetical protein